MVFVRESESPSVSLAVESSELPVPDEGRECSSGIELSRVDIERDES